MSNVKRQTSNVKRSAPQGQDKSAMGAAHRLTVHYKNNIYPLSKNFSHFTNPLILSEYCVKITHAKHYRCS